MPEALPALGLFGLALLVLAALVAIGARLLRPDDPPGNLPTSRRSSESGVAVIASR